MAGKSQTELSRELGISLEKLKKYEGEKELPDLKTMRQLSSLLGVKLADLMIVKSIGHKYEHCEYRKNSHFGKHGQEYVTVSVEDYLDRFFAVTESLGGSVLRDVPEIHSLKPSFDTERDAKHLRKMLGFAEYGAIPNLMTSLEDKGILIIQMEYEENFSGENGFVDGRPYIVVNSRMTVERQRSTLAHELGHIFFERPAKEDRNWEQYMTAVSGAFLFPREDALNELGEKRKGISSDMLMVCREYGISLQMLAKRASVNGIITTDAYRWFNISINRSGQRKKELSHIAPEKATLLEQLVLRATGEGSITIQRGAELLKVGYREMELKMYPKEMYELNGTDKQ